MGQFSFRISHAITVRKWLDVGCLKVFFTYRSGAGAGKIQAAGTSRAFLFTPSSRDCPKGSLQTLQRLSKCCFGPRTAPLLLHSTHQGSHKGPPSSKGRAWIPPPDGRRARKIIYFESSPRPSTLLARWISSHSQEKMLTVPIAHNAATVGTHALLLSLHTWKAVCVPITSVPKSICASFPSNCH